MQRSSAHGHYGALQREPAPLRRLHRLTFGVTGDMNDVGGRGGLDPPAEDGCIRAGDPRCQRIDLRYLGKLLPAAGDGQPGRRALTAEGRSPRADRGMARSSGRSRRDEALTARITARRSTR